MRVNVLNSKEMSPQTAQVLRRQALDKRFATKPTDVLEELDRKVRDDPDPDMVFAVAELSYLHARRVERLSPKAALTSYGGALAHAYFYLFDESLATRADPYDPRFRLACDLYNRSLSRCIRLAQKKSGSIGEKFTLDFATGPVEVNVKHVGFLCDAKEFDHLLFADDYEVRGLENHYHTYGLGVPLIAVRTKAGNHSPVDKHYPPRQSIPASAFLRMTCKLRDAPTINRKATLELYDPSRVETIEVAGRQVPLESDLTTPLGYFLSHSRLHEVALAGLLRADKVQNLTGLYMVQPYEKGKIPVVMVHGLWSDPTTWMKVFNDLRGDPAIREKYQFWFFLYPTGNPILYSASLLRQSLAETIANVDPKGEDASLRQMVLVGHSMGGILSKAMAQDSGQALWENIASKPVDELNALPEERDLIKRVFFFNDQPFVRRIVFIATPHRGSSLTDRSAIRLVSRLIELPGTVLDTRARLVAKNPGVFDSSFAGSRTSIDNLSPENPVLRASATIPIDSSVTYHSIIGNIERGEPKDGSDGVVSYWSSHLEGAASELIVPFGHNAHDHPLAILEIRRILLEHLQAVEKDHPVQHADGSLTTPALPLARRANEPAASPRDESISAPPATPPLSPSPKARLHAN